MIYLDSSALVKLAVTEPESAALAAWLAERPGQPLVSSVLHRAEVPRAVWRAEPGALPRSYRLIRRIARVALTADVLDNSATLPPQALSSAHAIHLASALAVRRDLTAFVAYHEALLTAAAEAGLPVDAPGWPPRTAGKTGADLGFAVGPWADAPMASGVWRQGVRWHREQPRDTLFP
jgi:uncharacterized protein